MPSNPGMDKLLLWDIDGTLMRLKGSGYESFRRAMRELFDLELIWEGLHYHGRTDSWIVREMLSLHSLPGEEPEGKRLLKAYLKHFSEIMHQYPLEVLPGTADLLARIAASGCCFQALLTGNAEEAAWLKIRQAGMQAFFPCGGFGDEVVDRNAVAHRAYEVACETAGQRFRLDKTWVIGDTPHDIACGRHLGARTLGVATGNYTIDDLRAAGPDFVFSDFSDAQSVLEALEIA